MLASDKSLLGFALALLALAPGASGAAPEISTDWPQWRGPHRDGISAETGWSTNWPKEGPRRLWAANVGVGFSSVSTSGGKLFTMGNIRETDYVICIDSATGGPLWRYGYPCPAKDPMGYNGTRCTPTLDGRNVYTLGREGQLLCINIDTGKLLWSVHLLKDFAIFAPQWGFSGSPLIEGGMVIVETGGPNHAVAALDKLNGKVVWANGSDTVGYSSPVGFEFGGQRCLAVFSAAGLSAREARTGRMLWQFPWKTQFDVNAATPIIFSDKAFISSGYNSGCALIQFTGNNPRAVWSSKQMRNHFSSCVLWQEHIYGFDESTLKCLDLLTGAVKWATPRLGKGSLMLADGKLICLSETGRLVLAPATPSGYKEIASGQVVGGKSTWAVPVLSNGRIYCRSQENLVCLDVRGK
jgi:outer membrane protein assembly factor BamB